MKEFKVKEASETELKAVAWDLRSEIDRYNNALTQILTELNSRSKQVDKKDVKESKDDSKTSKS